MKLTEITVSRTIPAPAESVFDVWIDHKSPGGPWFGADRVILNPVVDGLFYLAVKYEGRTLPHYGRFVRIERPRPGGVYVDVGRNQGSESVVTVTFEARRRIRPRSRSAIRVSQTMKWDVSTRKAGPGSYRCSKSASVQVRLLRKKGDRYSLGRFGQFLRLSSTIVTVRLLSNGTVQPAARSAALTSPSFLPSRIEKASYFVPAGGCAFT